MQPAGPAPGLLYAGFWIRLLAYLVDSVVLAIPLAGIVLAFLLPSLNSLHCVVHQTDSSIRSVTCSGFGTISAVSALAELGLLILSAVYFTLAWSRWGHTLGQRLCGLTVVDANTGGRLGTGRSLGRYVGLLVSIWVLYIGVIWAAFDPRKQGWHDKIASSFVVRRA